MTSRTLSPAACLFQNIFERLKHALNLREVLDSDLAPFLSFVSHAPFHDGPCGQARLFAGDHIAKVVTCSIVAPAIGLDSHMLFAFARSDSAVPHFTFDGVVHGEALGFHLDLIPRADLATDLAYMNWAYDPLTPTKLAVDASEGLKPAHLSPRQRATMSPWMLAHRTNRTTFASLEPFALAYLQHWLSLLRNEDQLGLIRPDTVRQLTLRDQASRAILFDPTIDPVWNQISGLIGRSAVEALRAQLLSIEPA